MSNHDRLLALDAGNTRVKWALWNSPTGAEVQYGAIATGALSDAAPASVAELSAAVASADQIVVANVAGAKVEAALRDMAGAVALRTIHARPSCCGVTNQYDDAAQLGVDRFAALIGAHAIAELAGFAKLVVGAGTAVTIDALTAEGNFLGGSILPGPTMMRRALHRDTATLPFSDARASAADFARNTGDAIAAGTRDAIAGAITIAAQRLARGLPPAAKVHLVLCGGAAAEIAAGLTWPSPSAALAITMREHLVLDGLRLIAFSSPPNK